MSDLERKRDKDRIDRMLDALEAEMGLLDGDERASMDILVAGTRAAAPLLERRAQLLGLDAKPSDAEPAKEAGPVARIMAVRPTGSG